MRKIVAASDLLALYSPYYILYQRCQIPMQFCRLNQFLDPRGPHGIPLLGKA